MKSELDHKLDLLRVAAKRSACFDLILRIRNECIGLEESGWAFTTGKIFGEYLEELEEEERRLNAEGEEYDKAKDAELEAARDKDIDIPF